MSPQHLPGIVLAEDNWENRADSFTVAVNRGMQGLSQGYDNGLVRINNFLYGTHPGRYYLIGADSGVGKTTLADFMFLIKMWLDCKRKGIPFKAVYFSFELSKEIKVARWICTFVKFLYNVDLPSDYVMGRIPGLLMSPEHFEMVRMARRYVDQMLEDVDVVEAGVHPTWMFNYMIDKYEKQWGTVLRAPVPSGSKSKGFITGYIPNDPRMVTAMFCDHLALAHEEKGVSGIKAVIDKISQYAVFMRNRFSTLVVFLQQFATDLMSAHRASKKGDSVYTPQRIDFGDSKYTYRDADVVFGLVSPMMFDIEKYKKYDIERLMSYFLALHLMKNRYGPASRMMPLLINPISGVFEELPKEPTNELAMQPYYEHVNKLEDICQLYFPKSLSQQVG